MLTMVFTKPKKWKIFLSRLINELENIGISSLPIVALMSTFIGGVIALQTASSMSNPLLPKYTVGYITQSSTILEFSPTIILRNSESGESLKKIFGESTEEDVNRDGTIIVLGSNQYKLPFQPGTVDDKGSTDFETSPTTFRDYPSELLGDQLLLNSGRVIISSKNAEMIFYSKKNYGFISDGWLSIDNKFGIEANVGDNINFR